MKQNARPRGAWLPWLTALALASVAAQAASDECCAASGASVLAPAGGGRAPLALNGAIMAVNPLARGLTERQAAHVGLIDPDHDDDYRYRLPYGDGVAYPVLQSYGARLSHRGTEYYTVDFGMPIGTPVHAAREGVVVLVEDGNDRGCWQEGCDRFANFVVVLHSDGTTGEYFHLAQGSAVVHVGDTVRRGQLLALSGNTGYTTAPHLHFGVYRATPDGSTASLPVRFQTRAGLVNTPRSGAYYLNLDP